MKTLNAIFLTTLLLLLASFTGLEFKDRDPVVDRDHNGTWLIRKAELGGKRLSFQRTFELQVAGRNIAPVRRRQAIAER